jgi:predicted permease
MTFLQDLKFALRSLATTKGLTITVVLTLALGIGANAAISSVVRGVLLRPLVNRDEDRLIYIRQSALGIGADNARFSVPEIQDLRERVKTLSSFGDFSAIDFTMVGLGEPREIRAGVVDGSYFEVMGLHPVLGRLLDARDDGPSAVGAVVLTYRFWTTALKSDASVLGKTVRLGTRSATIVGVLEPSVPYPSETEIIANIVTSPHHLSATMVTGRVHRMTELFGRLAPGADLEQARAELRTVHSNIVKEHPEAYYAKADFRIDAVRLRDQITSRAKTVLWVLLAASILVFVIACSNVANLILARTVRREGELAIRAALGASTAKLRRTLLAESLLLCGAGALLGVLSARPMVAILARYASRFSVRALDLTVDSTLLWVGATLAIVAAVLLAFVPRLPSGTASGFNLSSGSLRITGNTNRRLRAVRRNADRRVLRTAGGRRRAGQDAALYASGADRLRYAPRARGKRARDVLRSDPCSGARLLQRSDPPHHGTAGRGSRCCGHVRSMARRRELRYRLGVLGRWPRSHGGRGRSTRADPLDLARIFRGARSSDPGRP